MNALNNSRLSLSAFVRMLGLSRKTVSRFMASDQPTEYAGGLLGTSKVRPHSPYLSRRLPQCSYSLPGGSAARICRLRTPHTDGVAAVAKRHWAPCQFRTASEMAGPTSPQGIELLRQSGIRPPSPSQSLSRLGIPTQEMVSRDRQRR